MYNELFQVYQTRRKNPLVYIGLTYTPLYHKMLQILNLHVTFCNVDSAEADHTIAPGFREDQRPDYLWSQ